MARKTVYRGTNVKVDFELNRKGIAECAMGIELRTSVLLCATVEAKPYARSISPRSDRNDPGHVHYQDSFHVVPGAVMIRAMRRVAALLINNAPHATTVEWGNNRVVSGHRVLGRTLDHLNRPRAD